MSGSALKVLVAHRPPLAFVSAANSSREPIFTGFLVDLLPTLLQQADVQATYDLYAFQGPGGVLLRNGSWTGVMGDLTTGRADLALFPLTLTTQRAQHIEHTQSYMDDGYGMLVKTRQIDTGYSFLLPFETLTWVLFLLALVAVMVIISVLDSITRRARFTAIERTHGVVRGQRVRKRDKLMGHAIETVMMAVGSGSTPTSRSCSVKVMFVAWAIFCVIMLSAYTANLTANLTVNQIGVTIKSLSDLAQLPIPFGVPAESSVSAYFANSSDQGARSLRPKMLEFKDPAQAVEAVREGKVSAYINDYPTVQFFTQEPPCNLALGAETIGSGALVLGLTPNSTLTKALNSALLQLSEAGYLAELRRKWFVEASQCTVIDSAAEGDGRLSITQAWSVFLILAAGAGVAIIVALLEVLYYNKIFSGIQELKQDMFNMGPRKALKKRVTSSRKGSRNVNFSGSLSFDIEKSDPSFYSGSLQRSSTTDATVKHSGAHAGESAPNPRPVQGSLRRDDTAANHCAGLIDQKAAAAIARSGSSLQHSTSLWPRSGQEQQQQQPRLTPGMLQQAQQQQRQQLQTPFSNSGAYSGISHCPASTASSGPAAGNAARLGEWSSDSSEE